MSSTPTSRESAIKASVVLSGDRSECKGTWEPLYPVKVYVPPSWLPGLTELSGGKPLSPWLREILRRKLSTKGHIASTPHHPVKRKKIRRETKRRQRRKARDETKAKLKATALAAREAARTPRWTVCDDGPILCELYHEVRQVGWIYGGPEVWGMCLESQRWTFQTLLRVIRDHYLASDHPTARLSEAIHLYQGEEDDTGRTSV